MHIPNRKYEVQLPDGRIVSRQRAHQIQYPERYREAAKIYRESKKRKKGDTNG